MEDRTSLKQAMWGDTKNSIKWGGKSNKGEVLWGEWEILGKVFLWKIIENFNLLKYI